MIAVIVISSTYSINIHIVDGNIIFYDDNDYVERLTTLLDVVDVGFFLGEKERKKFPLMFLNKI